MPDYIKQLKIGNTDYNIKAEKASNNASSSFVVRDIQYGTTTPSGGESGQVYLQYDTNSTSNNYVYAEDTAVDSQNVIDAYYTKSEVDNTISTLNSTISALNSTITSLTTRISNLESKTTYYNYAWSGTTTSEAIVNFSVSGTGFVMITGYIKANASTDNYGLLDGIIFKSDNNGSSYYEISRQEWRKHGSGYMLGPAAQVSTATAVSSTTRFRVEFHRSFDSSHNWRIEILSVGCTISRL